MQCPEGSDEPFAPVTHIPSSHPPAPSPKAIARVPPPLPWLPRRCLRLFTLITKWRQGHLRPHRLAKFFLFYKKISDERFAFPTETSERASWKPDTPYGLNFVISGRKSWSRSYAHLRLARERAPTRRHGFLSKFIEQPRGRVTPDCVAPPLGFNSFISRIHPTNPWGGGGF